MTKNSERYAKLAGYLFMRFADSVEQQQYLEEIDEIWQAMSEIASQLPPEEKEIARKCELVFDQLVSHIRHGRSEEALDLVQGVFGGMLKQTN